MLAADLDHVLDLVLVHAPVQDHEQAQGRVQDPGHGQDQEAAVLVLVPAQDLDHGLVQVPGQDPDQAVEDRDLGLVQDHGQEADVLDLGQGLGHALDQGKRIEKL